MSPIDDLKEGSTLILCKDDHFLSLYKNKENEYYYQHHIIDEKEARILVQPFEDPVYMSLSDPDGRIIYEEGERPEKFVETSLIISLVYKLDYSSNYLMLLDEKGKYYNIAKKHFSHKSVLSVPVFTPDKSNLLIQCEDKNGNIEKVYDLYEYDVYDFIRSIRFTWCLFRDVAENLAVEDGYNFS